MARPKKRAALSPAIIGVYLATLLISFHYSLVLYINSSFITSFVAERHVGTLYILAACVSATLFLYFVRILRIVGNRTLITFFILTEAVTLIGLILAQETIFILPIFILHLSLLPLIYLSLDIFLERLSTHEEDTGKTRGMFLSMISLAAVISPFIVGLLLSEDDYWRVYALSSAFVLLGLAVILRRLRGVTDSKYRHRGVRAVLRILLRDVDFYNIFISQFLLRIFFTWMVIYMPIYLFRHIGFEWTEIGIIFTIMLLPFLLLDIPLGRLADTIGEKPILIMGFLLLAGSTALIPLVTLPSILWWSALLFVTRIGACFVEVATESLFFKQVDGRNAAIISVFRITRPVSYIFAASIASITLIIMPMQWSFLILAIIMLLGLHFGVHLRDPKPYVSHS